MPIKAFKGFNRRKSSGNLLEDAPEVPVVSSFRVLERPHEPSKSFDGGHNLLRATGEARPASAGRPVDMELRAPANRGSNGTQTSSSSAGLDTSSSSAHFSSTSTLPTFATEHFGDDPDLVKPGPLLHTNTAPPGFFRSAFAGRKAPQPVPISVDLPQHRNDYSNIPDVRSPNHRHPTSATSGVKAHSATPPALLGPSLSFAGEDDRDEFSNIFSGLSGSGKEPPKTLGGPVTMGSSERISVASRPPVQRRPPSTQATASQPVSPALLPSSQNARDGLLGLGSKPEVTGLRRKPSPQSHSHSSSLEPPRVNSMPVSPSSSAASHSPRGSTGMRERSLIPSGPSPPPPPPAKRSSSDQLVSWGDDDLALAMQYMGRNEPSPSPPLQTKSPSPLVVEPHNSSVPVELPSLPSPPPVAESVHNVKSPDNTDRGSIMMTPKMAEGSFVESLGDDASMQEVALYADRLEEERVRPPPPKPKPITTGKVMTPAQFERYKKEQERRQLDDGSDSESEKESEKEDEDDEEERNREMARQRRKQEADMAVYRQKMMKITGETARPASKNVSNLTTEILGAGLSGKSSGATSEEDEDDDVPLGILAAHGFPNKIRAPSHLNGPARASMQYNSETYPPPRPASTSGVSTAGGAANNPAPAKSVPAFAKNLPKDPFFGASLVTPADRQSLALNSGAASIYGGSQAGASTMGGLGQGPPGGLVGVIAKEERARALRRSSPSAGFEASNAASGLGSLATNVPGLPPALSSEQHAQMQMTQQMAQMMQVQMQWMQQMQQMMAMQQSVGASPGQAPAMPPMPTTLGRPSTATAPQGHRPLSSQPSHTFPRAFSSQQNLQSRASGINRPATQGGGPSSVPMRATTSLGIPHNQPRSVSAYGLPGNYAASLAPSERSTVGQPSRYRPVSTAPDLPEIGTNGGTINAPSAPSAPPPAQGRASPGTLSVRGTLPNSSAAPLRVPPPRKPTVRISDAEDEDEDAAWAAMQAARNEKRSTWARSAARQTTAGDVAAREAGEDLAGLASVLQYADASS